MLLTYDELREYHPMAYKLYADLVDLYLGRANAWCEGYIGGKPTFDPRTPDEEIRVKTAVALCFEIMARAETHRVNPTTGNITELAPPTAISDLSYDQIFEPVRDMLRPTKLRFENSTNVSDRGVKFI